MTGSPVEELDELDSDLDDASEEANAVVEHIREAEDGRLRLVGRYGGDEHDVVYVREDVEAQFEDGDLETAVETLVMKGLSDPTDEEPLHDFGSLDATVRWYDSVVVAHSPVREWSGLVFTFDRETVSLDAIVKASF